MKKIIFISIFLSASFGFLFFNVYPAEAEFSSTPDHSTWVTDDLVRTIVASDSKVYIGGDFSTVSLFTGTGVPLDTTTSYPATEFPIVDGQIFAAVGDDAGGWYIGGAFTQVGTEARNNIAHILSDGTVDSAFDPDSDSTVYALALSSDEATLYAGGVFANIGGAARDRIAALDTSDGTAIVAFDPDSDNDVYALALSSDDETLYIGGRFDNIGGAVRDNIAALDTSDGTAILAFDPDANSGIFTLVLSSDDAILYAGGEFATIGGAARNFIAALDTSDGTAIPAFDPDADARVNALALSSDDTILYIGGNFLNIGGAARNNIAALDTSDGTAILAFDPDADDPVNALALSSDDTTLYVGGSLENIGGAARNNIAALDTSDGTAILAFDPHSNGIVNALALSSDDGTLYVGGNFATLHDTPRNRVAAFSVSDGIVDSDFDPDADDEVAKLALSSDGSILYVGGGFANIGGAARNRIAALDTSDGTAIPVFDPDADGSIDSLALSSDDATLYAGGSFTDIGGAARSRIAALDTSDGTAIPAFDPDADDAVVALALSSDDATLYAGGVFANIGGAARNKIAALDTSDGTAIPAFDPDADEDVKALVLSSDDTILYAGGDFTNIGGAARNFIASLDTSDGTATAFDPDSTGELVALALSPDDATLYAGGAFDTIGGAARNHLAGLDTSDGTATAFDPDANETILALVLSPDNGTLYVGGDFEEIGGEGRSRFASFSQELPSLTTSAATSLTKTSATLNGVITNIGVANPTTRGFVYGPTTGYGSDVNETGSFSAGSFSLGVSGLTCATTYHARAYATNTAGTGYGNDISFTTSACAGGGGGGGGSSYHPPLVTVCKPGDNFSATTGLPCTSYAVDSVCPVGDLFSATTGLPCTSYQTTAPIVGDHTICFINVTLRLGSMGERVKCLQSSLNILADGIFGPKTRAAVITFQISKGLVPDGVFGPKSQAAWASVNIY